MSSQQAVALGSDVANLKHRAVAQIALEREVVLRGVLRAQVGLELAVKKNWDETATNRWAAPFVGVIMPPKGFGAVNSP